MQKKCQKINSQKLYGKYNEHLTNLTNFQNALKLI